MSSFSVVEFPPEEGEEKPTVGTVPSQWLNAENKTRFWPPGRNITLHLRNAHSVPGLDWKLFPYTRIFGAYGSHAEATTKSKHFENFSEVEPETEDDLSRRRKKRPRLGGKKQCLKPSLVAVTPPTNLYTGNSPCTSKSHHHPKPDELQLNKSQQLSESGFRGRVLFPNDLQNEVPPGPSDQVQVAESCDNNGIYSSVVTFDYEHVEAAGQTSLFVPSSGVDTSSLFTLSTSNNLGTLDFQTDEPDVQTPAGILTLSNLAQKNTVESFEAKSPSSAQLPPSGTGFSKGFQEVVLKKIAVLEENQNQILSLLKSVAGGSMLSSTTNKRLDFQILPRFPLNTYPELCDFEKSLDDVSIYDTGVAYFSLIGGTKLEEVVKNILRRLLSRDFALRFSFTGGGRDSNLAFNANANVLRLLVDSTRLNTKYKAATESEITTIGQNYFRYLRPATTTPSGPPGAAQRAASTPAILRAPSTPASLRAPITPASSRAPITPATLTSHPALGSQ